MKSIAVSLVLVVALGQFAGATDFIQMRIAHLSRNAPAVDVLVDGNLSWANVESNVITSYLVVRAGEHQLQFRPVGVPDPSVETTVTFKGSTAYTIATLGPWSGGDIQPQVFVDDLIPGLLRAKVRFLHASRDLPAVDVAVGGGPVLIENISFGQSSKYLLLAPGVYNLEVRIAGTDSVVLSISNLPLSTMQNCTIFVIGSGERWFALPVADMSSRASLFSIWVGAALWAGLVAWFIMNMR